MELQWIDHVNNAHNINTVNRDGSVGRLYGNSSTKQKYPATFQTRQFCNFRPAGTGPFSRQIAKICRPVGCAGAENDLCRWARYTKTTENSSDGGFRPEIFICQTVDNCEQVNLVARTENRDVNNAPAPEKGAPAGNAVGEVYLSEQTKQLLGRRIAAASPAKKILIMAPDVELSLLTAGGLQEPNALWTAAATNYVTEFTAQYLTKLGHEVAIYKDGAHDLRADMSQDLINLHEAVGKSIFLYQYPGMFQLPTKKSGKFDWKLGASVRAIGDAYGADLGLFFFVRDSYSSGSRVAAQVLMAALFGAHLQGGTQVGFVSLVDMKNGDILWYNRLISTSGDLRTFEPAFNATESLLENIPL